MPASVILIVALVSLSVAYVTYGRRLARKYGLDPNRQTPAHTKRDGVDYVPARTAVLMGHHFASIAGAAPIMKASAVRSSMPRAAIMARASAPSRPRFNVSR